MGSLRKLVNRVPGVARLRTLAGRGDFKGTADYWERRYAAGGNSGGGSYGRLAGFKAEVLNDLVAREGFQTVLELGCGDGHQVGLCTYPRYVGYDISPSAVARCRERFAGDGTRRFEVYDPQRFEVAEKAEIALSLDVVYHLVEDALFDRYLEHLFGAASKMVVVYAPDYSEAECAAINAGPHGAHVRHRPLSARIAAQVPGWALETRIPARYPPGGDDAGEVSEAQFLIYRPASR